MKGIVHPKIWMLSFTHPPLVPNLSFFCWAQKMFWRMLATNQLMVAIVLFFGYEHYNLFLYSQQKEETLTGLEQVEGE